MKTVQLPLSTAILITISLLFLAVSPARAATFSEEIEAALTAKDLTTNQAKALKDLFKRAKTLGKLKITDAKSAAGAVTGQVSLMKRQWDFLAYSGGDAKSTFAALRPMKAITFADLASNLTGAFLLDDTLKFQDQMLVYASQNVKIDSRKLPELARAQTDRFFLPKVAYQFNVSKGVTQLGVFDVADGAMFKEVLAFPDGKSSLAYARASLAGYALDDLLDGKSSKKMSVKLKAVLPAFRPKIGGVLNFPADVRFTLDGELKKKQKKLTVTGVANMTIADQAVPMKVAVEMDRKDKTSPANIVIRAGLASKKPWKKAFGLSWLTIDTYKMTFRKKAANLDVAISGKTTLGAKRFKVAGSAVASPKTGGSLAPKTLDLALDEGPDKVGELSVADIASIYAAMVKAGGGGTLKAPKIVPDVAIAGTEEGEGPSIQLWLKPQKRTKRGKVEGPGIDLQGVLRVFGSDLAEIERAFIHPDLGVEVRAETGGATSKRLFRFGRIKMPRAEVSLDIKKGKGGRIADPKLFLKVGKARVLGAETAAEVSVHGTKVSFAAIGDFGSLFAFDFKAANRTEIGSLEHLADAELMLDASLSADPVGWLKGAGKKAAKKGFGDVQKGIDRALAEVEKAEAEVDKFAKLVTDMKAKVSKERAGTTDRIGAAEAEVTKWKNKVKEIDGDISDAKGDIKTCNQKKTYCVWGKLAYHSCKKRFKTGKKRCIIPVYKWKCQQEKSIADIPARTACTAKNVAPMAKVASLGAVRVTVVPSLTIAEKSLKMLKDGIEEIPLEFDPRVAGLLAPLAAAKAVFTVVKKTLEGYGKFKDLLAKGLDVFGKADIFKLEKSTLRGDLDNAHSGKPLVLDMTFLSFGKTYNQRLAFSLTDMKYNAEQFEVVALGLASKAVIDLARKAKVIPYKLLDKITSVYSDKLSRADKEVRKSVERNQLDTPATTGTTLEGGIEVYQRERNAKVLESIKKLETFMEKMKAFKAPMPKWN